MKNTKRFLGPRILAVNLVLMPAALLTGAAPPRQQVFRATTDAISVDVAVRSGGRSVTGLSGADFTLLDNGVPQKIEVVVSETLPVDVSLVLDVSASVRGPILTRLKLAVEAVATRLNRADRLRLLAVSDVLREVFDFQPGGLIPVLDRLSAEGATSLYDGLLAALMKPRPADRRHLIVVFTDGYDTESFIDARTVRDVALQSDGVVHFVVGQPAALTGRGRTPDAGERRLIELAEATGGLVTSMDIGASVADAFKQIIADFRTSYVLRYGPTGVTREGWHEIKVDINRRGSYAVRARKGYFGG